MKLEETGALIKVPGGSNEASALSAILFFNISECPQLSACGDVVRYQTLPYADRYNYQYHAIGRTPIAGAKPKLAAID